ncbi:unnamed protein product, partial [Mesorhabditis spiculigera]
MLQDREGEELRRRHHASAKEEPEISSQDEGDENEEEESLQPPVIPPVWMVGIQEAPDWPSSISDEQVRDVGQPILRRLRAVGPIVALSIVLYIGVVTVYMHSMWWPLDTLGGVAHFVLFLAWTYATLNNFLLATYVGGGYIPKKWKPDASIPIEGDVVNRLQWCKVCDGFKPPRSHHCSNVDQQLCGPPESAFFVRFLLAAVIGCSHATAILGLSIYHAIHISWYIRFGDGTEPIIEMTFTTLLVVVSALALAMGVTVALTCLLFFQAKYILYNKTGVEEYIYDKAQARMSDEGYRGINFVYPYDLHFRRNISEVLSNFKGRAKGSGIWWPIRGDCTQFTFSEEQLRQKKLKRSHARYVNIVKRCSAGFCGSLCTNPGACICQPMSDQPRLQVEEGEKWIVTGGNKRWLYGFRQGTEAKGWFPRKCAQLLEERPHLE